MTYARNSLEVLHVWIEHADASADRLVAGPVSDLARDRDGSVPVRLFDDRTEEAMTYIAGPQHVDATCVPFDWYRDLVVTGAIEHGLPAPYIEELSQVPVMSDQNVRRAAGARKLLCRGSRL